MITYEFHEKSGQKLNCCISGELVCPISLSNLNAVFDTARSMECDTLSLDFSRLNMINSAGIGKLLMENQKLRQEGKTLEVTGCPESLYSIFNIVQANKYFSIQRKPA